jgi:hypothetical protein
MDIGDGLIFLQIPPKKLASTPEIAPKIPGFHSTALNGTGHKIVDYIGFL